MVLFHPHNPTTWPSFKNPTRRYLHSKGVIHRDLKTSNVLINKGQVKLADFGCSKKVYFNGDASENQHSMIGTVIYMAPEVMMSDGMDDGGADAADRRLAGETGAM